MAIVKGSVFYYLLSGKCNNEELPDKSSHERKKEKTGLFFICFAYFKFHRFNTDLPVNCV